MVLAEKIVAHLRAHRSPKNIAGQRRYGLVSRCEQLGLSAPFLRGIARGHRHDHALALALWETEVLEARELAALIDDPQQFNRTPFAEEKAHTWSRRRAEFVKRTAFSLMAGMAVHRKELPDSVFLGFLPVIRREAIDERNYVRKAVNWALRQIGKRNPRLCRAAMAEARRIQRIDSRAARWIAADALRELKQHAA